MSLNPNKWKKRLDLNKSMETYEREREREREREIAIDRQSERQKQRVKTETDRQTQKGISEQNSLTQRETPKTKHSI